MPSLSRTIEEPPSQPARKSQRTVSVAPVSTVRSVQVTPVSSCAKSSNATPQRASTSGSPRMASLQHRLDHHLADPHGGLARLGAVVPGADLGALLDDGGIAEAMQLAARQRRDPGDVEIVLLRHRHGAQLVGQAEPPEQLHRAAVGDVHLGMPRGRGVALDQQAAHAERGQRARQRHADRTAARDEDRNVLHGQAGCSAPMRWSIVPRA